MSLILEALRKSEAERRRGLPPDLHSELPPLVAPVRAVALPWRWPAGMLALAAVVALAWAARGGETGDGDPQDQAEFAGASVGLPDTARAPVQTASPPLPDPSSVAAGSPTHMTQRRVAPAQPAQPTQADAASRPAPQPLPPTPRAEPRTVAVREAPIATAERRFAEVAPVRDPVTTTPPAAAPAADVSAGPPQAMRLADLAPGERASLPALKISMHMWNPAAAQRFAIIDGQRVGEGSRVGDAVVQEITRDGVVLAWQGRQLSVPIR